MVRHTVSSYFTLLRDLNLDLSFLNSNVDGLEQSMKVVPAYQDEYLYILMQKIVPGECKQRLLFSPEPRQATSESPVDLGRVADTESAV